MGGRKGIRGTTPRRLPSNGKGWVECQASGFLRQVGDMMPDIRQGDVAKEFADRTPRFGTYHPQDLRSLGNMDDPKVVPDARPKDDDNFSIQDLGISDQEVKLSIQEGRPPRRGY